MDRERLIGAWQLVANEYRRSDGAMITPFGPDAQGLLIYSDDGYMSVQVGRRGRKPFGIDDMAAAAPEEMREAFTSYFAYFGPFSIDESKNLMFHSIEGSTMPNWVGAQHSRIYALAGDTLTLRSTSTYSYKGEEVTGMLVWKRVLRSST